MTCFASPLRTFYCMLACSILLNVNIESYQDTTTTKKQKHNVAIVHSAAVSPYLEKPHNWPNQFIFVQNWAEAAGTVKPGQHQSVTKTRVAILSKHFTKEVNNLELQLACDKKWHVFWLSEGLAGLTEFKALAAVTINFLWPSENRVKIAVPLCTMAKFRATFGCHPCYKTSYYRTHKEWALLSFMSLYDIWRHVPPLSYIMLSSSYERKKSLI